jgi:hypothetical protein
MMYYFYAATCQKFWGWSHYLNLSFFREVSQRKPERALFVTATSPAEPEIPVAMSLLIRKDDRLYGRYWGCREEFDHLHFETCYYQPIQWAIQNGVRFFDAGSGSALHKQRRGFPAQTNYSMHRHYHPIMQRIWQENITHINKAEQERIELINNSGKPISARG